MFRHGKLVSNLKADMKYFPVSKPIENENGAFIEPEPSRRLFFFFENSHIF
jgi:hypothetical protein